MIYLDNNTEPQQVYIPRETLNLKTVSPISSDPLEDYYTKSEVDRLIENIEIPDVNLSEYATVSQLDSKQEKLVSGVNINKINNKSLLDVRYHTDSITTPIGYGHIGRNAVLKFKFNERTNMYECIDEYDELGYIYQTFEDNDVRTVMQVDFSRTNNIILHFDGSMFVYGTIHRTATEFGYKYSIPYDDVFESSFNVINSFYGTFDTEEIVVPEYFIDKEIARQDEVDEIWVETLALWDNIDSIDNTIGNINNILESI